MTWPATSACTSSGISSSADQYQTREGNNHPIAKAGRIVERALHSFSLSEFPTHLPDECPHVTVRDIRRTALHIKHHG